MTFTEGMEGEGAGDVREAEILRFRGFCRPWAAALSRAGVYSCSCAQVGMQWGHLGPAGVGAEPAGLDPKLILGKYNGLCFFDSTGVRDGFPHPAAVGTGFLAKQE